MKHVAIRVISSHTEDQIITSDPSQILAIRKAKEEILEQEKQEAELVEGRFKLHSMQEKLENNR
jgi:hypothetical protein